MSEVKQNDTIKVHYTGKLKNGEVFDSSENKEPLEFKVGEGKLIKEFEQAVIGLKVDESKTIDIDAGNAYGEVKEELFFEVPKNQLPEDLKPEIGMQLVSHGPDGNKNIVTISKVLEESVMIDGNHPLAGQDLTFDIKVVEIL